MGDSFYLTLPSNVKSGEENNTTSRFRTILKDNLDLSGRWYVALSEIQYPFSWSNVDDDEIVNAIMLKIKHDNKWDWFRLRNYASKKHYDKISDLTSDLEESIKKEVARRIALMSGELDPEKLTRKLYKHNLVDFVSIRYDSKLDRVRIKLLDRSVVEMMNMPRNLMYIMGFKEDYGRVFAREEEIGPYPPDIDAGLSYMYVYCDAVAPQIVGDTAAPLLRVVNLSGKNNYKYGSVITETYADPHYVPVVAKSLHGVLVELKSDQDKPIRFNFGKSIVKLHFKRKA